MEVVGFIFTEYQPKPRHGSLFRINFHEICMTQLLGPASGNRIRILILTPRCAQGCAQRRVRIFYGFLCLWEVRILDSDPESWILPLNLCLNLSESRMTILTPRCAQGGAQRRVRKRIQSDPALRPGTSYVGTWYAGTGVLGMVVLGNLVFRIWD